MSISISNASYSYSNSASNISPAYAGYYLASLYVETIGDDLDHIEVLNSGGFIDVSSAARANSNTYDDPRWVLLVSSSYRTANVTLRAVATNLGVSSSYDIMVELKDYWAPILDSFTTPPISNSRTIDISHSVSHVLNDPLAYYFGVSEINNPLTVTDWNNPTTYTFASDGTFSLYAWVKDYNDNISSSKQTVVIIDSAPPSITFSLPTTSISSIIPISNLIVNDDNSVKFAITQSSEVPTVWQNDQPTQIVVNDDGEYTFYCWVKDIADNTAYDTADITVTLSRPVISVTSLIDFSSPLVSFEITVDDAFGISNYYVSETSSIENAVNYGLIAPTTHTFSGLLVGIPYSLSLYFWARNGLNVLNLEPFELIFNIFIPDTVIPTITSFSMPAAYDDPIVPINSIVASDNVAVTGYFLSESFVAPTGSTDGWQIDIPTEFTFSGIGTRRVYLWIKDGNNNISLPSWADISIADNIKPVIRQFVMPAVHNLLVVPITILATDNIAITGYYLSESDSIPPADSRLWLASRPTSYKFNTYGLKTLNLVIKDVNNNISDMATATCLLEETIIGAVAEKYLTGKEFLEQHIDRKTICVSDIFKYVESRLGLGNDPYSVSIQTYSNVTAYKIVALSEYGVYHPSASTLESKLYILGIALNDSQSGFNTYVKFSGIIELANYSLVMGKLYYLGENGSITEDVSNFPIGIAVSTTSLCIKL